MFKTILLVLMFGLGPVSVLPQVKQIQKCKVVSKQGYYKLISEDREMHKDDILIFIVVKPEKINEAYLRQVAGEIKSRYCNEKKVIAVISDSKKLAEPSVLFTYSNTNGRVAKMRGFYSFDRNEGTERLEFSTRRGNRPDEIKVKL